MNINEAIDAAQVAQMVRSVQAQIDTYVITRDEKYLRHARSSLSLAVYKAFDLHYRLADIAYGLVKEKRLSKVEKKEKLKLLDQVGDLV